MITEKALALKWSEHRRPSPPPIRRMRLTDCATVQAQAWSSLTRPNTDYALAVAITEPEHETERDSLLRLAAESENAINALRQLLGTNP